MDIDEYVGDSEEEGGSSPQQPVAFVLSGYGTKEADEANAAEEVHGVLSKHTRSGERLEPHDETKPNPSRNASIPRESNAVIDRMDETFCATALDATVEDISDVPVHTNVEMAIEPDASDPIAQGNNENADDNGSSTPRPRFRVGDIVNVEARTWPGINKQGGAGKVLAVLEETDESDQPIFLYNVKYMLGGFEKRIEEEFLEDLVDVLESGSRPHVGRRYYHEEFVNDPHKKKTSMQLANSVAARTHRKTVVAKSSSRAEDQPPDLEDNVQVTVPDNNSGGDYEDSDESSGGTIVRRLDDGSFILATPTAKVQDEVKENPGENAFSSQTIARKRRHRPKRRHDRDSWSRHIESTSTKRKRSHRLAVSDDDSDHSNVSTELVAHSKKHRYIGGYVHGPDNPEGSFIQPEGNPMELPEDVAREFQFKLGKSKSELRSQLDTVANLLVETLEETEQRKIELTNSLNDIKSISNEELCELNVSLLELGNVIRRRLIRSGEDAMNLIIKALERRGGHLPERIDLQFEGWKQRIADYDLWVKHSLKVLARSFDRRGMRQAPIESLSDDQEYSADLGSNDELDIDAFDNELSDVADSRLARYEETGSRFKDVVTSRQLSKPKGVHAKSRYNMQPKSTYGTNVSKSHSRKRPRIRPTQTTLDTFEFLDYDPNPRNLSTLSGSSNFRLVREKPSKLVQDPRWNWTKLALISKKPRQLSVTQREFHISNQAPRPNRPQGANDSIQVALRKLRNRRNQVSVSPGQRISQRVMLVDDFTHRPAHIDVENWYFHQTDNSIKTTLVRPSGNASRTEKLGEATTMEDIIDWAAVFGVLPEPNVSVTPIRPLVRLQELGCIFFRESDHLSLSEHVDTPNNNPDFVVEWAARLRQGIVSLRHCEAEAMQSMFDMKENAVGAGFMEARSWKVLVVTADAYLAELRSFSASILETFAGYPSHDVPILISVVLHELASVLKQIPDCNSIFGKSPTYPFFFEVAAPDANTTPLLSAICQTYWYCIQLLVVLQRNSENSPDSLAQVNAMFGDVLPINRVALACNLFLVDLFIYLPASHRIPDLSSRLENEFEDTPHAPALSMWLLLHDIFLERGIHSSGSKEIGDSDFWSFLQTTYRERFVQDLASCYMNHASCGGYMRERPPTKLAILDREEALQSELLSADLMWDLAMLLASALVTSETMTSDQSSAQWGMIKELLHENNDAFLPFNNVSSSETAHAVYRLQSYKFKVRVLQRVARLSVLWAPSSDVVEIALQQIWGDSNGESENRIVILLSFIGELREVDCHSKSAMHSLVCDHIARSADVTGLLCQIILVHMSKLDKPIYRNRYRQPLLRAISMRCDAQRAAQKHQVHSSQVSAEPREISGVTKSNTSWNWNSRGINNSAAVTTLAQTKSNDVPNHKITKNSDSEAKTMVSILFVCAIAGIYPEQLETNAPLSKAERKSIKRDAEFYCKEICGVLSISPRVGKHVSDSLHTVGSITIEAGAGYNTVFAHINDVLIDTARAIQSERNARNENANSDPSTHTQPPFLIATLSSYMETLHGLSMQLIDRVELSSNQRPYEVDDVCASIAKILNSGLAGCLDEAVERTIPLSVLKKTLEIVTRWLPYQPHEPAASAKYRRGSGAQEVDEFDDPDLMDVWATVNLDNPTAATGAANCFQDKLLPFARETALSQLRLSIQRLVISLPPELYRTSDEIYVIDLLGSMISSCSFQFSWKTVTLNSLKPRFLAPRLLASIITYNPQKKWLSTFFLSENLADQELASMWIVSTLDLHSLLPNYSFSKTHSTKDTSQTSIGAKNTKYATYWLLLSDGIISNILGDNHVVKYKMDIHIYGLLHRTSSRCSFPNDVYENPDPVDTVTLYGMHVDLFRSFCRSVHEIWDEFLDDPNTHRQDMNRFRIKMMDTKRGIFVSLLEAYEINLRAVCTELDRAKADWYTVSQTFIDSFAPNQSVASFHGIDDASKILDQEVAIPAMKPLIVLFKLMYDCVDAFLFHCGGLAIGQRNIFFSIMELMFRQARCAEFPLAKKRLATRRHDASTGLDDDNWFAEKRQPFELPATQVPQSTSISPACSGFVENVRLFFAYQKYPSLVHWFAETLDTYQTSEGGWDTSPLRILLCNALDPHGPLGIHSYYPINADDNSDVVFDPSTLRREAFYLACGLFLCKCTNSYEHTKQPIQPESAYRLNRLRSFVLKNVVAELINTSAELDETMLPVFQLVKAVLQHCNLDNHVNVQEDGGVSSGFDFECIVSSLSVITEHIVRLLDGDDALESSIRCVLQIEYFRILEEVLLLNSHVAQQALSDLLIVGLRCCGFSYQMLQKYSALPLEPKFVVGGVFQPSELLGELKRASPAFAFSTERVPTNARAEDDYGISNIRVRLDLLSSIRRLTKCCADTTTNDRARMSTVLFLGEPDTICVDYSVDGGGM